MKNIHDIKNDLSLEPFFLDYIRCAEESYDIPDEMPKGISEEEQKCIFERFYMVDKSRKRELGGNGLGLAITKKIVDLHEGSIRVESEINKGASFIVSIPIEK